MPGTPSFIAKAMFIGERVQNFRCRQPEGSGSSGKLRPKSITVTIGPPSGFKTSSRPPKKFQPIRPTAAASATPPIRMYRARQGILSRPECDQDQKPLTEGIVIVSRSEVCSAFDHVGSSYYRTHAHFFQIRSRM